MGTVETLNQALQRAAAHSDSGLRILDRRERATWLGWSEVYRRARGVAGGLSVTGIERGDPVGLFFPTGEDFFAAFFGTLLAGAVPVPLYPPVRLGRLPEYQHQTTRMLQAVGVKLALADPELRRILGEALAAARCKSTTLGQLPQGRERAEDVAADALALVQFSSGTTVDPKPVALSHRSVMAQVRILNGFWPDRPSVRHSGVSWLPLYHDMGLIGCVFPALERPGVLTLIPPQLFVARPAVWLRTISRYRGTISPAPNFAYGLCVEKICDDELEGVDLGSWRVALNGAEAVVPTTLRAFAERFSHWGFRARALTPVYGLSEAALAVTFSAIDKPFVSRRFSRQSLGADTQAVDDPDGVELVSVGRPLPGFELEVRGEAGEALGAKRVGRIWVRGPSLMEGYLNQTVATAKAMKDGWLDTGDLGFVLDGDLYVTGRAKDVLIVRGCNHTPDEIEAVINELPEARTGCSAAVGYMPEAAEREQVWLFVEKKRNARSEQVSRIAEACRRLVLARTGIALDEVLVLEPGTLPRTSSGKIRRHETLRRYLAGELTPPERVTAGRLLRAVGRSMVAQLRLREES